MSTDDPALQEAARWARTATDEAVEWFMHSGVIDAAVLEAKPAWALPPAVFIAMVREQGISDRFFWLIGGNEYPRDYIDSSVAASVREAARHFSLKWQLEAARLEKVRDGGQDDGQDIGPESGPESGQKPEDGARLVRQAESLYRLVNDDALWRAGSDARPA